MMIAQSFFRLAQISHSKREEKQEREEQEEKEEKEKGKKAQVLRLTFALKRGNS